MDEHAHESAEPLAVESFRPTRESKRIEALDVARGLALLGIFMVNIMLMTQPMLWYIGGGGSHEGGFGAGIYYATKVLFESKSYPLFSMLFGMGLMLMHTRAKAAGRGFVAPYLRRLTMLFAMGVCHALFLWFGDVLAVYAMVAIIVMWLAGLQAKWLYVIAGSLVGLAVVWTSALAVLGSLYAMGPTELPTETDVTTFAEFIEALTSGQVKAGPVDPAWAAAETDAFKNGPYSTGVMMRGINWSSMLVFWMLFNGAGLHIAGMFLLGAALMKSGAVTTLSLVPTRMMLLVGGLIGIPGAIGAVWLQTTSGPGTLGFGLSASLILLVGPCVSLGYFGLAKWLATNAAHRLPVRAVAAAGRMALTNYLSQTLIVAILAQSWGLAWFGDLKQTQMLTIVLSVYLAQLIVSPIWLSYFTMGPLEWLWRWWTYLKPPRLIRRADVN